jgi:hypothetical protein
MDMTLSQSTSNKTQRGRWLKGALLALAAIVIIALLIAYQLANRPSAAAPAAKVIPASLLEERYGLRVNLIGVTAAGGLVDLRLKVLDIEKAKALLNDPKNFPAIKLANSDITLMASEDSRSQALQALEGGLMIILYPNQGNALSPNGAVSVMFGDMQLEPIAAK